MAVMQKAQVHSLLSDFDIGLFLTGKHFRLYQKLGARQIEVDGIKGTYFAVFAPAAETVCVEGDFSEWKGIELNVRWDDSGIWEGFIPHAQVGHAYKYLIDSKVMSGRLEKADPFATYAEKPPQTASLLWESAHRWTDKRWMQNRKKQNNLDHPISIYEMHLGSWRIHEDGRPYSYLDLAAELPAYINKLGFTHVELMPVMEHPYDPSWGYQITGFFAPTSRFGTPDEFRVLIQALHKANIGVLLDWVPSHFPSDAHGLGRFDGSCIYEHPDYRKGYHPDWDSLIFNYERPEVRAFLISNALYWLDEFHIDGFRVDAVASMLYLDYSREEGAWEPNIHGGNENLDAISFLKELNETVYAEFPDTLMIAEESTAFAGVSHPTYAGGLGFGMKWMMGWMHDTLDYFKKPTVYRQFHHGSMSFSIVYAFSENFVLPFSHDEVVHGKASLLHKMPGDDWQQFANLRLLYGYMFVHPGAKLLFMGGEFGQRSEWNFASQLEWNLLEHEPHVGLQNLVCALNGLYKERHALHQNNFDAEGFEWIDFMDHEQSVLAFLRKGISRKNDLVVLCNFTEVPRKDYQVGVPQAYAWKEIFNSDAKQFGGSDVLNTRQIKPRKQEKHGKEYSIRLTIPPLGMTVLERVEKSGK